MPYQAKSREFKYYVTLYGFAKHQGQLQVFLCTFPYSFSLRTAPAVYGEALQDKELGFGYLHIDHKWITQSVLAEGLELKDMGQSVQVANGLWEFWEKKREIEKKKTLLA